MKRYIPYIILFILLLVALILFFRNNRSSFHDSSTHFEFSDTSKLDEIRLINHTDSLVLIKKGNMWKLNNTYKAANNKIRELVLSLNHLEIKSAIAHDKTNHIKETLYSKGTRLILYSGSNIIKTYCFYTDTLEQLTYCSLNGYQNPYIVEVRGISDVFQLQTNPCFWRDTRLFSISPENFKSLTIEYSNQSDKSFIIAQAANNSLYVASPNAAKSPVNFDKAKASACLAAVNKMRFRAFVQNMGKTAIDSIEHQQVLFSITLETTDGPPQYLKAYPLKSRNKTNELGRHQTIDPDYFLLIINNEPELLLANFVDFDEVTRELDYFLTK